MVRLGVDEEDLLDISRSPEVRQLTESEKEALIEGLKAKWEKVNTDYQATTHITKLDTIGKATFFFVNCAQVLTDAHSRIVKAITEQPLSVVF